jgi:hypothetical protein
MIASLLTLNLKLPRLSGILDTLEVRNQQAMREQWTYKEFLTRLVNPIRCGLGFVVPDSNP